MKDVSAAFQLAALERHIRPIFLVHLLHTGEIFSSQALASSNVPIALEGLLAGSGQVAAGSRSTPEVRLPEGAVGALRVSIDPESGAVRRAGTTIRLLNQDNYTQGLYTGQSLDNVPVEVRLGFKGLAWTDCLPLFRGVVDSYEIDQDALTLYCLDDTWRALKSLSVPIGLEYFPGTPRDTRGSAIPIIIGRATDIVCLPLSSTALGSLAEACSSSAVSCLLVEFDAPFPASGTISLGSETGVTYTSRDTITQNGQTYLRLSGLTRGSPVSQAARSTVTLTSLTYKYLVGYQAGAVTEVRDEGELLDVSDYTVTLQDSGGPSGQPVTTILLDSAPVGEVTCDADGKNVQAETGITNGGFETGDTTGWTAGAGSTATVSSGSAYVGTYKCALEGDDGVFTDLYQDFSTVPGRYYTLELAYKDQPGGAQLLTNGGFESGLTTGWTHTTHQGPVQTALVTTPVQEGSQALKVFSSLGGPITIHHEISQEFATSIGADYSLIFTAVEGYAFSQALYHGATPQRLGSSSSGSVSHNVAAPQSFSRVGYSLGTPANPGLYASVVLPPRLGVAYTGEAPWRVIGPITFTAQSTTSRLALRVVADSNGLQPVVPTYIDAVVMAQTTNLPLSLSGVRLGTAGDDDLYVSETFARAFGWTIYSTTFLATSTSTRVTLQSQWSGSATASLFDHVRLLDAGRNPADAIAHVIDTYTDLRRSPEAFNSAYEALKGWQFGAYLPDPGPSDVLLERMARQCKSRLITDANGRQSLKVFDWSASSQLTLGIYNGLIAEEGFRIVREPLEQLATDFSVRYGLRAGESPASPESYQGVVYATPDATTHRLQVLPVWCSSAQQLLRRRVPLEMFGDMIRDQDTAHLLLEHLVQRHTFRQDLVSLRTFSTALPLELGDFVTVLHPWLAAGEPTLCEVMAIEIDSSRLPDLVGLELRTVRLAGFYEPWEEEDTSVAVALLTETWES
jgi:hypothetical protein